jgi:hypothetical protein
MVGWKEGEGGTPVRGSAEIILFLMFKNGKTCIDLTNDLNQKDRLSDQIITVQPSFK